MIGLLGHISIISAGITALILWIFMLSKKEYNYRIKTYAAWLHLVCVLGIVASLYYLIFTNQFQYHYVWHHSAIDLPLHFKISCLWEGQEGSFLLWIFWNALLLIILVYNKNKAIQGVLKFFIPIQLFLISMILGIELTDGVEIGSTPFSLLKDKIHSEIYAIQPNFIPSDGTGMNALLQNYWMVIHPPVIFLGFALAAIPFSYCLFGLSQNELEKGIWVKPATPWIIASILCIGTGMIMGAYWAYETLNFGGFWNWDPVENAIFIPWLILIGALHLAIIFNKKKKALNALNIFTLLGFVLVLYSTFLTRSGILGDSSVHSFTDLGLSGQLLMFLLFFLGLSIFYLVKSKVKEGRKDIIKESELTNFELWMFAGVLLITLSAFQVFLPTSFPVFNKIAAGLGFNLNLAAPANQVKFYTDIQHWFALAILLAMLVGQLYYWKSKVFKSVLDFIFIPLVATSIVSGVFFFFMGIEELKYILSFTLITFTLFANGFILFLKYDALKNAAGSLAHVGVTVMILGILISQAYQKVLTDTSQFKHELNRAGNVLLVKNKPVKIKEYDVTYHKSFIETTEGEKIDKSYINPVFNPNNMVFNSDYEGEENNYKKGDEITVDKENAFYKVSFKSADRVFTILPRIQYNSQMGVIASPDIDRRLLGDIYTHVSNYPDPDQKDDWSKSVKIEIKKGDEVKIGSKTLTLKEVKKIDNELDDRVTLKATLELELDNRVFELKPVLILSENDTKVVADEIDGKGFQLLFHSFNAETDSFGFAYLSSPKDWITIKSIYFPMINLVWFGAILMLVGLTLSLGTKMKMKISSPFSLKWEKSANRVPTLKQTILQIILSPFGKLWKRYS